jgi:transcriptional regulator ATRX
MLMRQNADIKNELLADSDEEVSSAGELTDFVSDDSTDEEDEQKSKQKIKEKSKDKSKTPDEDKPDREDMDKPKVLSPLKRSLEKADDQSSDEETHSDKERRKKPRVKRDSFEREIFSKSFLEINGTSTPKSLAASSQSPPKSKGINIQSNTEKERDDVIPDTVDLSMFDGKRVEKEIDLQKVFERRANAAESSRASPQVASYSQLNNSKQSTSVVNDDDCIYLSSDSDSEISAPAGSQPKRKKMLTEEELQEETKKAQKEKTQRIERLKKKNEKLTQMLSQRLSQESDDGVSDVILDYEPKRKVTISVHKDIAKQLKQHQREGVKFMYDTCFGSIGDAVKTESGCILAHCMGLGKTLQLITLVHTLITYPEELKTSKILVICPKSTIMNWYTEFKNWLQGIESKGLKLYFLPDQFAPAKNVFEERSKVLKEWFKSDRPGIFLINYDGFRNLVNFSGSKRAKIPMSDEKIKKIQSVISECLLEPGPDLVVCDEGHLIKNETGATNKAITKISTKRRIILTGTPVQNNLNEYYAMVNWIKPALLGTTKEFNNLYANPIKDGQNIDSSPQAIKRMKQRSMILNKKLSNIVQRKEAGVLKEFLPEKYEYCIFVPLTQQQEVLYEEYLSKFNFIFKFC